MENLITTTCDENCLLDISISPNCEESSPGGNLETIYIIDKCKIEKYITYDTNVVDDIVLNVGEVWNSVIAKLDTASWEVPVDQAGGFYTYNIQFTIDLLVNDADYDLAAQTTLDFLNQLRNPYSNFVVVLTHNNGRQYVFGLDGKRGLKNGGGTVITSGAALADASGITVTLTSASTKAPRILNTDYVFNI